MSHAPVQSFGVQAVPVFLRTQFGLSHEPAETEAGTNLAIRPGTHSQQEHRRQPCPPYGVKLKSMPGPGCYSKNGNNHGPERKQDPIGRTLHLLPARSKWMNGEPE